MKNWTTLVTILTLFAYFGAILRVGFARKTFGVAAPAITGNPTFERIFRSQQNMLEWMPIFLPSIWIFAFYVSDGWAALLGMAWIIARMYYAYSYAIEASKRSAGFTAQLIICAILALGGLLGVLLELL